MAKKTAVVGVVGTVVANPNRAIDYMVVIDTTPSMQRVQHLARRNAEQLIRDVFASSSNARFGVIFVGDLSDDPQYGGEYVTAVLQPTNALQDIVRFIRETPSTNRARGDAAYQEVLYQLHSQIRWRKDAKRVAVMIGDTSPDPVHDNLNRIRRDAYVELDKCVGADITFHSIHCPTGTMDYGFWKAMPARSGGQYLVLNQFDEALDILMASMLFEIGPDVLLQFEKGLRGRHRFTRGLDTVFAVLLKRPVTISKSKLTPVHPSKFQILEIGADDVEGDDKIAIKAFVEAQGFKFEKGRGFYELGRSETIQGYKEIVVMDRATGDMFTGEDNIRALLNIPVGTSKVKLRDVKNMDKYRVFIQSTSVNRRLVLGAMFLYDIEGLRTD